MKAGWKRKEIADLVQPLTTIDPRKEPNKHFTYIDVSSVSREACRIVATSSVKGADVPSRARRLVKAGDVIFATIRPTLQRVAEVPRVLDGAVCSTGYFVLRPKSEVLSRFLFYSLFTRQFSDAMAALQRGAAYPAVSDGDIKGQELLIPPLPEQKRIVAILDEAFAGIATAVTNTEKNLANARELFESYLNSAFSPRCDGWTSRYFGYLANFKNGLNFTKTSSGECVRIVGVKNFKTNYWVPFDDLETAQVDGQLSAIYELKKDDLVIVRSNGNKQLIGRCLLVGDLEGKISHSGFTIRARLKTPELRSEFLAHYLRTSRVREQLIASGDGANISSLNQKALATLPVNYPDKDEQTRIVQGVQEIDAETKLLQSNCYQKLAALAELKQSLLQKAFSGELTAGKNASDAILKEEHVA